MKKYHVKLIFTETLLGTVAKDREVYSTFIAGKVALTDEAIAEELATVEEMEEKGWTGFHTLNGGPVLYDYAVKGFFKDACSMLRRSEEKNLSKGLTAFRKIIDGMIFVEPRQI